MHEIPAAFRQLRKSPGFAATVLLTIALGIGANTAIFTLVHGLLLSSLPVSRTRRALPRRFASNDEGGEADGFPDPGSSGDFSLFSYGLYQDIRQTTPEFEQLAAMETIDESMSVRRGQSPGRAERTEYVSGNYFQTLGLTPFAGRLLNPADDAPQSAPVVVISYAAWQSDFDADPGVVGETLAFQGHPFTVAGIAPPAFFGDRIDANPPAFWIPLSSEPLLKASLSVLHQKNANWLYLLGRLKPSANPESVSSRISIELRHWLATVPAYNENGNAALIARQHVQLTPGGAGIQIVQLRSRKGLYLLAGICALVLLAACSNVANLLLARGSAQRADVALRIALGASRVRLIRQMLVESVLLACLGGLAGLAIAYAGTRAILALAFPDSHHLPISASPSLAVLGFAFLLSLATGILFGIAPAWIGSHANPAEALRGVNRSTSGRASAPQRWLVIFQAALSLILLVAAGLLTRSLGNLQHQNLGIRTANRYIVHLDPLAAGYTPETVPELNRALLERFSASPQIANTGLAIYSPLENNEWASQIYLPGHSPTDAVSQREALYDRVSPQFFAAIGEPLLRGRVFNDADTPTSPSVAVVNQAFAKFYFPGQDPIGRRFGTEEQQFANAFEVVGVVADAKFGDPSGAVQPMFFRPVNQQFKELTTPGEIAEESRSMVIGAIVLQFKPGASDAESLVRRTLAEINPNLTASNIRSFQDQVEGNFSQDRLLSRLSMLFGALALLLAAVGMYGVTSYQVSRRTNEIGIRMALGATRNSVLRLVMRGAFAQLAIGLVIGLPIALLGAHLIASQLYNVHSYDPLSLLLAIAALLLATAVAGLLPARRAASVEPVTALRAE
jgi:predicted permease